MSMKKFTPIEWQSFSLKKDIEAIKKELQDNHVNQFSLAISIIIAILGAALENVFSAGTSQPIFLYSLIVASLFLLSFPTLKKWCKEMRKKSKPGFDQMDTREFINAFDNEITYYILMAESFYTMLIEVVSNKNAHDDGTITNDTMHFYYIQASYYFKKTIYDLGSIYNIADKVLDSNIDEIADNRLISYARYNNVKNLLATIYQYLDENKNIVDDLNDGNLIVKLNENFNERLNRINFAVNKSREWVDVAPKLSKQGDGTVFDIVSDIDETRVIVNWVEGKSRSALLTYKFPANWKVYKIVEIEYAVESITGTPHFTVKQGFNGCIYITDSDECIVLTDGTGQKWEFDISISEEAENAQFDMPFPKKRKKAKLGIHFYAVSDKGSYSCEFIIKKITFKK